LTTNPSMKNHLKTVFYISLTIAVVVIGYYFFKSQGAEIKNIPTILGKAKVDWILISLVFTGAFLLLHTLMYVFCFRAVGGQVNIWNCFELFSKRMVAGIFMPAGGVTSLSLFSSKLVAKGIPSTKIHLASTIFGMCALGSVAVAAFPLLIYLTINGELSLTMGISFISLLLFIGLFFWGITSIQGEGKLARWLNYIFPSAKRILKEAAEIKIRWNQVWIVLALSVGVELVGMIHVYTSLKALTLPSSIGVAIMGYIVAVLILSVAPVLRGVGPVEVGMTWVLTRFGLSLEQSIATTLLFRIFEFWIPAFIGTMFLMNEIKNFFVKHFF
jgi:phosphatidylglycerol lysyltransferase